MILLYAGPRPGPAGLSEDTAGVIDEIEEALRRLAPRLVIGSAAAGGDLLVLEAALRRSIEVRVLLADDRRRFRAESVADKGEEWGSRFDRVLQGAGADHVIEVPRGPSDQASYRAVTVAIGGRAEKLRHPGEDIAVLVISSPRGGGTDHTEELASHHAAQGREVVRISPA